MRAVSPWPAVAHRIAADAVRKVYPLTLRQSECIVTAVLNSVEPYLLQEIEHAAYEARREADERQ
jgi:hypothetical protein